MTALPETLLQALELPVGCHSAAGHSFTHLSRAAGKTDMWEEACWWVEIVSKCGLPLFCSRKKKKVDKHESHFWPLENSVKEGPLQAPAWGFPSTEQNTRLNLYKKYSWPFYADGCSTLGKQGGTSWVIWTKLVLHIIFSLKDIWDLAPLWNSMCWKWRTQPCSLKKTFSRDKYFTMYIELDDQVLSGEENMFGLKILDLFQVITKGSLVK